MSDSADIILGIDLGTTFSLAAYLDQRGAHILRDENGDGRLPSVLGVVPRADGGNDITIGWDARRDAVLRADATVYSVKRLIGQSPAEIARELPFLTYAVVPGPRDTLQVEIGGRRFSPEEISAVILRALRDRAEAQLNRPIRKAVITVPAYFDDAQRQATRSAGEAAGLDVVRIINEPTAAALAYGIGARGRPDPQELTTPTPHAPKPPQAVAGSPHGFALPQPHCSSAAAPSASASANASASHADGNATDTAQTVAIYDLGGGTFDLSILRIEDDVFQVLATRGDTHLGGDDFDRTIIQLVTREVKAAHGVDISSPAARQALRGLAEAAKIRLGAADAATIELDLGRDRKFERTLTRPEFDTLVAPLVDRTLKLCDLALQDAGLTPADLDQIILVGGSTRMPIVRERVAKHFGRPPYTALNPDEVVAIGAAVQGAMLAGRRTDLLLLDVLPLSLGIETLGGAVGKLIMRNTTIPCRATEMFTTFVDGQTAIKLTVLQGERELAEHCRKLAEFELRGIPPMPAGLPKVEVEFLVDANGILNVSAREQRSGVAAQIQVVPNYGLTRDEVARMMQESIASARDDFAIHRRIDLRNQVTFDTQKCEQMLARLADQLSPAERDRYERAIADLRRLADETNDLDALHAALQDFGRSTLPLAERGITAALTAAQRE